MFSLYRNLKENCSYIKTLVLLSILFLSFSFGSVFISDILLPVSAAVLSLLFLFDKTKVKWLSISVFAVVLLLVSLLNLASAVFVLTSFLCAVILFFGYCKGLNKGELSLYLTFLYALCTAVGLYFIGAKEIGSFDFSAVLQYYTDLFDSFVNAFLEQLELSLQNAAQYGQEMAFEETEYLELFELTLRSVSKMFLSLLVVVAFFYAGLQIKLFTAISRRIEETPRPRNTWYFALSNLFAYFYVLLAILSIFVANMDNVIGITIANLNYIFMFVFAYVGLNYALYFTSRMRKKALARFILIAILLTSGMVAFQLLSFVGVFVTTMHNKISNMTSGGPESPEE